jgi:hypothetical protein
MATSSLKAQVDIVTLPNNVASFPLLLALPAKHWYCSNSQPPNGNHTPTAIRGIVFVNALLVLTLTSP